MTNPYFILDNFSLHCHFCKQELIISSKNFDTFYSIKYDCRTYICLLQSIRVNIRRATNAIVGGLIILAPSENFNNNTGILNFEINPLDINYELTIRDSNYNNEYRANSQQTLDQNLSYQDLIENVFIFFLNYMENFSSHQHLL